MAMLMKHTKLQIAAATAGLGMMMLLSGAGMSQDKDDKAKKEAPAVAKEKDDVPAGEAKSKHRSLVRAGYTRPGSPEDRVNKKGKLIPAFLDPERDAGEPVIGGTVYFAVFRLNTGEDELEKDLTSLPGAFVKGRNFENSYSPEFDRKAKYLYVYQIVNDRGLDPTKDAVVFAGDKDLTVSTISDFGLRITVDPRYITSWGHFRDMSFSAAVPTRDRSGDYTPAVDGSKILPVAFSSVPSILAEIPEKKYQEGAPAHKLGELMRDFSISSSNLNLEKTPTLALLQKKKTTGVALANWEGNQLQAVDGGRAPDYVQLVLDSFRETEQPTLDGRFLGNVTFRADFKQSNALGIGQHSVVFGFTSDLPPKDEPVRIEGFMPRGQGEKGKPAAFDPDAAGAGVGVGTGNAVATGTAPTPQGAPAAALPSATGTLPFAGLGGGVGTGGGLGGGGGLGVPLGGFGAARAPAVGGGSGGGSGGGEGQGQGDNKGQSGKNQDQDQEQGQGVNVNVNVTQNNNQQQKQQQKQKQNQKQNNDNDCGCPPDMVIPAPPALLLGLFGFPAIFALRRRFAAKGTKAIVP